MNDNTRPPHVVERPFALLSIPLVDHLGEELGRSETGRIVHYPTERLVETVGKAVLGRGPPSSITHRRVEKELHDGLPPREQLVFQQDHDA
jgi:hypothetical protein